MKVVLLLLPFMLTAILQAESCHQGKEARTGESQAGKVSVSGPEEKVVNSQHVGKKIRILPEGTWGGQQVLLNVTAEGARVEFDCAHGTIDQRFETDLEGKFDLAGTYEDETGGPSSAVTAVNENETASSGPKPHPARYKGTVTGREMRLTVTQTDSGQVIGPFKLGPGVAPRLHKCLS
jgi:hypothetical protein